VGRQAENLDTLKVGKVSRIKRAWRQGKFHVTVPREIAPLAAVVVSADAVAVRRKKRICFCPIRGETVTWRPAAGLVRPLTRGQRGERTLVPMYWSGRAHRGLLRKLKKEAGVGLTDSHGRQRG
jgi:hypothetical protein